MFKTVNKMKQHEKGFSLLELAVAVGIAAIVAGVAVTATTGFVNGASTTSQNYETAASSEISNAQASFDGLGTLSGIPGTNNQEKTGPTLNLTAWTYSSSITTGASETWSVSTPVLWLERFDGKYAWIPLSDAEFWSENGALVTYNNFIEYEMFVPRGSYDLFGEVFLIQYNGDGNHISWL